MAVNLSSLAGVAWQFFDNNGKPLSGGLVYTYDAGTTTPAVTYTSINGITAHSNPIVLDAAGRVPGGEIWLVEAAQYKFVIKDSVGVQIGSYDNVTGYISSSIPSTITVDRFTGTGVQVAFTLTTFPGGIANTQVYINGVYQDKNTYSLAASTITFSAAPPVGSDIEVIIFATLTVGLADAANVTYNEGGTGAVTTSVQAKLQESVSVKDFGAIGDGITNDTAAINAALASVNSASNLALYFPAGTYKYAGGGVLGNGVVVTGAGRNATTIRSILATPTDSYLFNCSGYGCGIRSIRFDAAGTTQTDGSYVWLKGPESFIDDFEITNDFNGILMSGNASRIRHGRFQDGATNSIRIRAEGGDNSQLIDDVLMGGQTPQIAHAGIRVRNSAALIISNTSVINQGYGLLIDPTTSTQSSNTADGNVYSLYVNNCFFDTCSNNAICIMPSGSGSVVRSRFANCWAGSSGSHGILINNAGTGDTKGLYFDSCHAVLNGTSGSGAGISTIGTVSDIVINGGLIAANVQGIYLNSGTTNSKICNATVGTGGGLDANTTNGIVLDNGTSNILVMGNVITNNIATGVIAIGTSTGFLITNNYISGNGTNLSAPSTTNRVVRNNIGLTTPDIATSSSFVPSGATSVVVNHNLGVIPDSYLIQITPTSGWGSNPLYIDTTTITSTQFTVKASSAVSSNYYFSWSAKINNN